MHGREGGENRKLIRHMLSVSSTKTVAGVVEANGCSSSCFYKDGRKISVGDCALFKPAEDSPPFVGIIRCLTSEKESNLKLRVNWLYRPAEVKLPKGIALEAALNEVFYSFHSDEIPAASLLHPCKVAFLRKGVELPPGVSSFICRRVYDFTNKSGRKR
ncbi:BAH and coiled-coil domain-containing protein 1 [Bienertia sinuspersici]